MNFKKTIAKSLVVAMALGMVPVANLQTAKAADAEITFNGVEGTATATNATFWGLATVDAKGGKGSVKIGEKSYKIKNIQEYAEEIDLYAALKGKAGILAVGNSAIPDNTWKVKELAAADNTFKVQFVASTAAVKGFKAEKQLGGEYGYFVASQGKQPKEYNLKENKDKVEVKLNDGSWKTFANFFGGDTDEKVTAKLKAYGQSGSTLTFRIKGDENTWASKESKVKLATQAKAPSVKIDVAKDTTSIKTGMEYQVVKAGGEIKTADWKLSTERKGLSLAALALGTAEAKDVAVRTAATAKKLASKVVKITVNKPAEALTINGGKFEATGAAIGTNAVLESNLAYDITKGASLTNKGAVDLEYTLVPDNTSADKIKWNTLKASKDPAKKPTKVNLKYSANVKANTWGNSGTKLFVRLAGAKQTKENVATQSGVSVGAVVSLSNIAQKFVLVKDNIVVKEENTTKAAIEVATATALDVTFKGKIDKLVKTGVAPKVKLANGPQVKLKAEKVAADGTFEIKVSIPKTLFKDKVEGTANIDLSIEGVKDKFAIEFKKKN